MVTKQYCRIISCENFFQSPKSSTINLSSLTQRRRKISACRKWERYVNHHPINLLATWGETLPRKVQEETQHIFTFIASSLRECRKKRFTERWWHMDCFFQDPSRKELSHIRCCTAQRVHKPQRSGQSLGCHFGPARSNRITAFRHTLLCTGH